MTRKRIIIQAMLPVIAVWIVLFTLAELFGANWPDKRLAEFSNGGAIGWQTFGLSVLVISVFMLKARIAVWNTHHNEKTDWLAWTFAWLDITIVMFLTYVIFSNMWPNLRMEHGDAYRIVYQLLELNIFIAAILFLYFFIGAIIDGRLRPRDE